VTTHRILEALRTATTPMTAVEIADATGVSRATAQRYLADLAHRGKVELSLRYGSTGRPEHMYRWRGNTGT
jgi:two-component system CitB family response regulator